MIDYICNWCGKSFMDYKSNYRRYCTKSCFAKWQKENMVPPARKGVKLRNTIWNKGKSYGGVDAGCAHCSKLFKLSAYRLKRSKNLFCSKKCQVNWRAAHNTSPENKRLRRSKEFTEWRRAVFERDDYTCQFCSDRGGVLHPDHIKQFAFYPELRFEISNGRTLCEDCHRATPTWGARKCIT